MEQDLRKLKSGTDVRGVALPDGGREVNLTNEAVRRIAHSFALWLAGQKGVGAEMLRISVGHDSRLSAQRIKAAVLQGLGAAGCAVTDVGLISTPAMFMTCVTEGFMMDGAVMITASHHPFDRNGLKFFTPAGGLEEAQLKAILELANATPCQGAPARVERRDFLPLYAQMLADKIRAGVNDPEDYAHPLKGLHVVVDAGNGVGGFFVDGVLAPLGADTTGSRFLEPDGRFPNHIPNPEEPEAMASIREAVLQNGADIGLIFDTDVDRAGAVDRRGNEINRNKLIALIAAIELEEHPGGVVVTDSITSTGLKAFIEQHLGGKHYRYRRGYKNVIDKMVELNAAGHDCPMAMETSGHGALAENYNLDDGAYLMVKILIRLARQRRAGGDIADLIRELKEPLEMQEVRLPITEADFAACGQKVIASLESYAAAQPGWQVADDNREGIRVSFGPGEGEGWFLLRLSVHDPIMPLNIESDAAGGARIIAQKLLPVLQNMPGLDVSPLEKSL